MKSVAYADIRKHLRCGDLMCFRGRGLVSNGIRLKTMLDWPWWAPNPSHIGIVLDTWEGNRKDVWRVNVIESTSLNGHTGVFVNRLSERLANYAGTVAIARVRVETQYWTDLRGRRHVVSVHEQRRRAYLEGQRHIGKHYDFVNALKAGLWCRQAHDNDETLFCSELACRMHKAAGWLPDYVNPDEVTPKDAARWSYLEPLVKVTT